MEAKNVVLLGMGTILISIKAIICSIKSFYLSRQKILNLYHSYVHYFILSDSSVDLAP